jgi:predicted Na+-dependent transporter
MTFIWSASLLLAVQLAINTLEADPRRLAASLGGELKASAALLVALLFVLPVIQTGAASLLLGDRTYVFGVAAASIAPPALVIPLFLRRHGGDPTLGLALVVAGTLICPFVLVPMLALLGLTDNYLDTRALFLTLLPLTVLPVAVGLTLPKVVPGVRERVRAVAPAANALLLGVLFFLLVGSALQRLPLRLWLTHDLLCLTGLMVWMDFGVYFVTRWAFGESAALILGARNFAVIAGLLLFFDPKAALPAAVGLVVHAVFFSWLMKTGPHDC